MNESPGTVLLVLTEESRLGDLSESLTDAGIDVRIQRGPEGASGAIRDHGPDVMLIGATAVNAPLLEAAGAADVVIVAVATEMTPDERAAVLVAGADDLISLPVEPVELIARVQVHLRTAMLRRRLRQELASAQTLAGTDPLTDLGNRRAFEREVERQLVRQRRSGEPFAVLLADLDDFKRLNDDAGHPVGDLLLVAIGQALRDATRGTDFIGRIGGDEFAVILPGLDLGASDSVVRRIQQAVAVIRLPELAGSYRPRISIGGASARVGDGSTPASLLDAAGLSLRQVRGRDC